VAAVFAQGNRRSLRRGRPRACPPQRHPRAGAPTSGGLDRSRGQIPHNRWPATGGPRGGQRGQECGVAGIDGGATDGPACKFSTIFPGCATSARCAACWKIWALIPPSRMKPTAIAIEIEARQLLNPVAPYELVKQMRAVGVGAGTSAGRASGKRESHAGRLRHRRSPRQPSSQGLEKLGASISFDHGYVGCPRQRPARNRLLLRHNFRYGHREIS